MLILLDIYNIRYYLYRKLTAMKKIIILLALFALAGCQKDDIRPEVNQITFTAYGENNHAAGFYDGNEWTTLCYSDSLIMEFTVSYGDTLGAYNNGTRSVLSINGEVLFDLEHETPIVKFIIF